MRPRDDRQRVMITPEGLALPLRLASRSARFAALMLDLVGIGLAMIVTTLLLVWLAGGVANLDQARSGGAAGRALEFLMVIWLSAMFLFRNAWFLFFELGPRGATPGKRATGIRIAARDGGRLSAEMVIARNLLRDIELFMPLVFLMGASDDSMGVAGLAALGWFLVFALMPCFNRDRLRAGDIIAGTWVVEAPRLTLAGQLATQANDHAFSAAELAVYGEYELQTLEKVLREDRDAALVAVHQAICRKLGREARAGNERAFLNAFYTALRARLEAGMRLGQRKPDKFSTEPAP
ncbi:MAG TPA: RDD family protein [Novosphingobium sp.]|nr:RDD family protein [Novosphingobium sp.]